MQLKLLAILESVGLEPGATRPAPPAAKAAPQTAAPAAESKSANSNSPVSAPRPKAVPQGCCPQCKEPDAFKTTSWCKACGFYPSLNKTVDLGGEIPKEKAIELDEVFDRVPQWCWLMAGGMLAIVFLAVLIRLLIPGIEGRSPFGLLAIVGGFAAVASAHVRAFYVALASSANFKIASMFTQITEIWRVVFQQLPNTRKLFYSLAWGATAMAVGLLVIDLDWNGLFKPSDKPAGEGFNPMRWVMRMAGSMMGAAAQAQNMSGGGGADGASLAADMLPAANEMQVDQGNAPGNGSTEDALTNFAGKMTGEALEGGVSGGGGEKKDIESLSHEDLLKQQQQAAQEEATETSATKQPDKPGPNGKDSAGKAVSGKENGAPKTAAGDLGAGGSPLPSGNTPATLGLTAGLPEERQLEGTYLILGYTLSITGNMHSVVVAEVNGERVRYVDNVPVSGLPAALQTQLQDDLDRSASDKPFLKLPFRARWCRPAFECVVGYRGKNSAGKFDAPVLKSYSRRN